MEKALFKLKNLIKIKFNNLEINLKKTKNSTSFNFKNLVLMKIIVKLLKHLIHQHKAFKRNKIRIKKDNFLFKYHRMKKNNKDIKYQISLHLT
jgi:hypothetical protein